MTTKPVPVLGHLPAFMRDPLAFLRGIAQEQGDVAAYRLGRQQTYLLSHPDLVKEVLVTQAHKLRKGRALERAKRLLGEGLITSDGEIHRRQRPMVQPAFHRQRIAGYAAAMVASATQAAARWQEGQEVDMASEMHRLTLAIVGRTLFDADVEGEARQVGQALLDALECFTPAFIHSPAWLERLPLPRVQRFKRSREVLDGLIYRMIAERRAGGEDRGDLLSMLLAATAEGDGQRMSDEQARDEAVTLFLAGHETTSNALTWTWHLLGQHPEVEARLHEELDRVLGGRAPTFDDLPRLAYTRQVFAEAMRVYPPVWAIGRRVVEPLKIRDQEIAPGSLVFVSQYVMHHDARYFPEPERFDPERWTEEATASRPRYAYFPFGGGPRLCIGDQFAWMEGVLILAVLAGAWRAVPVAGHPVTQQALIVLRPRHGVKVRLQRRLART